MPTNEEVARAAARMVKKWLPVAQKTGRVARAHVGKQWMPTARQSGIFIKHVVPAAAKPIHSLWHEILGFFFLVFAGMGAFKLWQHPGALPPVEFGIVVIFVVVMASYGVSSIRKARRISRS